MQEEGFSRENMNEEIKSVVAAEMKKYNLGQNICSTNISSVPHSSLLNRSKKGMVEKAEELLRFLGMEGLIP